MGTTPPSGIDDLCVLTFAFYIIWLPKIFGLSIPDEA